DSSLKNTLLDIGIKNKYLPSYLERINNYSLINKEDIYSCSSLIDEALSLDISIKDKQYLKRKKKEINNLLTSFSSSSLIEKEELEKISLFDSLKISFKSAFNNVKTMLIDEFNDLKEEFKDLPDRLVYETKKSITIAQEEKAKKKVISIIKEENFNKLSEDSKTYLVTGYYLYTSSNLSLLSNADYSSIIVTFSKILECEFKKRYYYNYLAFLKLNNYPLNEYPNQLLYINNDKLSIRKESSIKLGNFEYMFNGEKNKANQDDLPTYKFDRIHDLTLLYYYNKEEVFTDASMEHYKESIDLLLLILSNTREFYRNLSCHDKKVSKTECDNFIYSFLTKDNELSKILDLFKK
ncbi:MAG: hypothetical protein PUF99_02140, partial [Bacilli bacterium]|nr:hypothetical protein [Bacilli bacterium]